MATVEVARLPLAVANAINAQAVADAEPTLRLYDRDGLPAQPVEPYGVIDFVLTEIPWDPTLHADQPSGVVAWVVTASADRRDAALWLLDVVRRLVGRVSPAAVTLTGTTRVICMWSAGTPSTPIEVGDIVTTTETFYTRVEAT